MDKKNEAKWLLSWIRRKCFVSLEKEAQKNHLLLFVLVVSFTAGEINILLDNLVFSKSNLLYLSGAAFVLLVGFILIQVRRIESTFKYVMMLVLLGFSILQLCIFNQFPSVIQVLYFNLALTFIYLNGRLILFVGFISIAFICFGHLYGKDLFFPWNDPISITLGIFAETTLVSWASTHIKNSFNHIVDSNVKMKQLLMKNHEQFERIEQQNKVLEEYARQVEQLTLREERDRVAKELNEKVVQTLTSVTMGIELTKKLVNSDQEKAKEKLDGILEAAHSGLDELRDRIYQSTLVEKELSLLEHCNRIMDKFRKNTRTTIRFTVNGEEYEVLQQSKFVLIRCLQESLTNALRHNGADFIECSLSFDPKVVRLLVMDNGKGTDNRENRSGIMAMTERVQAVNGELHVSYMEGAGATVLVLIPVASSHRKETIRVLLVDDEKWIRESLDMLLSKDTTIEVVGTAKNGLEAIDMCLKDQPDVILMDTHMPGLDGVETTRRIKEKWPDIKIIMLTAYGELQYLIKATRAGAEGYLIKSNHPKNFSMAIQLAFHGGNYISQDLVHLFVREYRDEDSLGKKRLLAGSTQAYSLKERELQVLRCLTQGLRYKEISAKLNLSEGTVRNYISSIYSKLEVQGRDEVTRVARENGIV